MSFHARKRLAAISAAIPVLLAGGPLVSPAYASGEYSVTSLVSPGQIIGPNVGYLGQGIGHQGTTAMFKITPPAGGSVSSAIVTLGGETTAFNLARDVVANEGLALYADTDGVANGFSLADRVNGLRSSHFEPLDVDNQGNLPVKLHLAEPVTAPAYYVTIRPHANAAPMQKLRFEIRPGDIDGSGGDGPAATVSTPSGDDRIVLDSLKPGSPDRKQFVTDRQPAGTQDAYNVNPVVAGGDTSLKLIFFNGATDSATSAILRRPEYDPTVAPEQQLGNLALDTAIDPANPAATRRITIGDGTGIVPGGSTVARNNQLSNNVYVRFMDAAGNLSPATQLWDCNPNTANRSCGSAALAPYNGNPVIAPVAPTSVAFQSGNSAVGAVNISNEAGVPVQVVAPGTAGVARDQDTTQTSSTATKVIAQVAQVGADGKPDFAKVSTAAVLPFSTGDGARTTQHAVDTRNTIDEGKVVAIGYLTDNLGNVSLPVVSGSIDKDITRPVMTVSLPSGRAVAIRGEQATVRFTEPMTKASITEMPVVAGTGSTEQCAVEPATGKTVSNVLLPVTPNGARRIWGVGNCFKWNADGSAATIRFGDQEAEVPPCDDNPATPTGECQNLRAGVGTRTYISGTNALTDLAGNQTIGIAPVSGNNGYALIETPAAEPLETATAAITQDLNADGLLDAVDVDFTLGVDLSSFDAAKNNLSIVGPQTVPVTSIEHIGGQVHRVRFKFVSTFGTGVTPVVRLIALPGQPTGLKGTDGRDISTFGKTTVDRAKPRFKSVVTNDSDDDGMIDRVIVTYSEPIDHTKDNNNRTVAGQQDPTRQGGYRVVGYENIASVRNSVSWSADVSDTKIVSLAEKSAPDTGAVPQFNYNDELPGPATGNQPLALFDPAGNMNSEDYSVVSGDGVGPRIMTRTTKDITGNGRLDELQVTFSEPIPATRVGRSVFSVAGFSVTAKRPLGETGLRLILAESTTPGVGDTGTLPGVQYLGEMTDMAGNPTKVETAAAAPVDGAGPAIMGACVASPVGSNGTCPSFDPTTNADRGAKLGVFFSELLDPASAAATEFVVEQPANTDKGGATAVAVAPSADNKYSIATLTYAADTLDHLTDVFVKLGAAGVVTDNATPTKNPSTQTSFVTGTAYPVVDLALSCASQAKPGFCPDLTVNMTVTGNSGVTQWRLEETERATVPAPEEFKTVKPGDKYTFPAEGEYTLYLSGMDAFGRLSAEISKTIWILKAPTINDLQFQNTATRTATKWPASNTVLDGDALKMGADAYGTDAEEWVDENGNCNKANMSIDVRHLTRRSTDGQVGPSSCELLETEQPGRQMIFPTVRASGTTKYPVGTVLRMSSSDPGSLVVDGPNGTIARRQFISVNARRSWQITDASVITVTSSAISGIPRIARNVGYRDGSVLKSSTGYYYVENGVKRPVSTYRLSVWKISTARAYVPTSTELRAMPTGTAIGGTNHAAGTWIKYSNGTIYHLERNAAGRLVRRKLASSSALRTLVPSTQIYAANSSDSKLPVDTWLRGYRDGTLLRFGDGSYGVISRSSIRRFANPQTFNTLGFNGSNALTANGAAVSRVSGQTYRIGATIDRYSLAPVIVKVTNIAGTSATAQLPSAAGLYGVGTIDAIPAGWDTTR